METCTDQDIRDAAITGLNVRLEKLKKRYKRASEPQKKKLKAEFLLIQEGIKKV